MNSADMATKNIVRARNAFALLLAVCAATAAAAPAADGEILVGTTGYGRSPEYLDMMRNDAGNLWVQWTAATNLLPEALGREWCEWAVSNRVRVMTIYGNQDGALTKRLREAWGDLYLGNNIGEYAGFIYQDANSYFKGWPKCRDLREARDWFVGRMLARPRSEQLARPAEEREPYVFSTSGSPLACYELAAGIDYICNEMYAVGCGNLAYATAEARGATRRCGRDWWSAWLAHEWQTCWPRLPYSVPQKMDSLEIGLKELWVMGTSMMVLESGSQSTQAQNYTPPDGTMAEFSTPRQGYDDPVPRAYRRTMGDFYRWTREHPRAKGSPVVSAALLLGNCDGYAGMTFDTFAIFGQHHLAETNSNWRCGAPEFTWEAVADRFFPRPADALKPFANGWLGGTPHGQLDVVNVDDALEAGQLARYRTVAFGGWNTMTEKIASCLRDYVAQGGNVILCTPQLSSRVDREYSDYTADDLVQAVPGVKVGKCFLSEDILMLSPSAPEFLRRAYPAHLSAKLRVAEAEVGPGCEVLATMGRKPYLVKARHGKGAFYLVLAWDYPAARREREEFPSHRRFRLEFWETLLTGLVDEAQPERVTGPGADYVNWALYPDGTVYLLNTDCTASRSVEFRGATRVLAPKELLIVRP